MSFCSQCGNKLEDGDRHCPQCGQTVDLTAARPVTPNIPPGANVQQPYPNTPPGPNAQPPYPNTPPGSNVQQPYPNARQYYQQPPMPQNAWYPPPPPPPSRKKSPVAVIVIIIAAVVLILLVGLVAVIGFLSYADYSAFESGIDPYPTYPAAQSSAPSDTWEDTDEEEDNADDTYDALALINEANKQFAPAPQYEYLGIAYFLDDEDYPRDSYVPYGTDTEFSEHQVYSKNHGVSIQLSLTREYADAKEALDNFPASTSFPASISNMPDDLEVYDLGGGTADNNTVGASLSGIVGTNEDGSEALYLMVAYADIRDDGYYMIGYIIIYASEYDDETALLLEEINDCYAITLPTDLETIQRIVTEKEKITFKDNVPVHTNQNSSL